MAGTACVLVVRVVVVLVVSKLLQVCHVPHVVRDVHLLSEVLDVEAEINDLLLILVSVEEGHQE